MASAALPQTLKSITATKITELSKQRTIFNAQRDEIIAAANQAPNPRAKVQILLEGITRLKGHPNDALDSTEKKESIENDSDRAAHVNIRRFLFQSQYDSSAPESRLKIWIAQLEKELRHLEVKHDHAAFYSALVTEWLASLDGDASAVEGKKGTSDEFQSVGRAEMHEQRAIWESYVFNSADVDADTIRAYLDRLFKRTLVSRQALDDLRKRVKDFGTDFAAKKTWFTVDRLKWVSKALLKSDLLSNEKAGILKEFMRNKEVTREVADVLNMRLASLANWSWPDEGLPLEMRRQLNGKYRVFMDEDLLDSLMLQYLGRGWAVTFRHAFDAFLRSRAWKFPHEHVSKEERERRQYFRDRRPRGITTVNEHRRTKYENEYFMTQLPRSLEEAASEYGDEDGDDEYDGKKSALDTKHSLLHMLITESILQKKVHGQFTAIRSDFKFFGPSLPHTTMLMVLEYFGVPEFWLNFFKTFLEAPLKFTQDGPQAAVQVRRRGVPMSHSLSDCFGEVVLFCMDYSVNQYTNGAFLYRLHDDFWFWGQEKICVRAWKAMAEFTRVMGLEFNGEKTGTVQLTGEERSSAASPSSSSASSEDSEDGEAADTATSNITDYTLPTGEIRWGFLKLDAEQGRFVIDQTQVDSHIAELQTQLSSCKSIFVWTQAWNSYFARFFSNNFGKPAICFGREHIDMAISTLSRIERTLFPAGGGVTAHLRAQIAAQFDIHDLPEGFFYFPVELGGLELLNPYIPLLAMRENITQTPHRRLEKAFVDDELAYHAAKEEFKRLGPNTQSSTWDGEDDDESAAFLSLEEYMRHPEARSAALHKAYTDLMCVPEEVRIDRTPAFRRDQLGLDTDDDDERDGIISDNWSNMTPYWRWVAELYHEDMVGRFGGLAAVDREFMPLGVVKTLKEGRFRWQG